MTVAVDIEGVRYELREDGSYCSRVFRNGNELERFKLQYTPRQKEKAGHAGVPTAEIAMAFLKDVHDYLKTHPEEVPA